MSATNSIDISVSRKAKMSLSVAGGKDMELSGATKNHRKLKNLGYEESGHTGFQKELTEEELEAIASVPAKEDKSNKINSWDEYTEGMTGDEEYPTINMMMQEKSSAVSDAVSDSNAYTDAKVGQLVERVTTNEESITGAFGAIQSNESRILTLEGDMGEVETALDNIIAIQNTLIGGGSV